MEKIVICVCTRERPKMLKECLESLIVQEEPRDTIVSILVVENDKRGQAKAIIDEIKERSPFKVFYVIQPVLGISQARNSALRGAHSIGADWIAFIDDDDVANFDWIEKLVETQRKYNAEAVTGPQYSSFPPGTPKYKRRCVWGTPFYEEGSVRKIAATNNFMFNAHFVKANKIVFDNSLAFHAGEDTLFSYNITKNGGKIIWTNSAIVTETIPAERTTLKWYWKHSKHSGIHSVYTKKIMGDDVSDVLFSSLRKALRGAGKIALSPFAFLWGGGMKTIFSGVRDFAKGYGVICGMLNIKSEHYKKVTGE